MKQAADDLAVVIRVQDSQVKHDATPWRGSCVEVFGSTPDAQAIGQVFLTPQADDNSPQGYRADGSKQTATTDIRISSTQIENGYELRALVPLSLLKIDPKKEFLLEFQASSHNGKSRTYHTLFGSKHAYQNNQRFGSFTILDSGQN